MALSSVFLPTYPGVYQHRFGATATKQQPLGRKGIKQTPIVALVNPKRMTDSFIAMAKIDTMAKEGVSGNPSTPGQVELGKQLAATLRDIGLTHVKIDKDGVVSGKLKSNLPADRQIPTIGLFAHLDTALDAPSKNVRPRIHKNYQGGRIHLNGGTTILAKDLKGLRGHDIITTDGTTLLGADDKAGIAEIVEALRVFKENPSLSRPHIKVAFTPDEEIAGYINKFNVRSFGADAAYTIDGSTPNTFENESFNAYSLTITVKGVEIHPGYAQGKMVNPITVANDLLSRLPKDQVPETTQGRQGFYYTHSIEGGTESLTIHMLVRDFDKAEAKRRVDHVKALAKDVRRDHPKSRVTVQSTWQYGNMGDELAKVPHVSEYALEGIRRTGLTPKIELIRGGTDGSNLTLNGLPTPNLPSGAQNIHSKREFVSIQHMTQCVANIVNTMAVWAENT